MCIRDRGHADIQIIEEADAAVRSVVYSPEVDAIAVRPDHAKISLLRTGYKWLLYFWRECFTYFSINSTPTRFRRTSFRAYLYFIICYFLPKLLCYRFQWLEKVGCEDVTWIYVILKLFIYTGKTIMLLYVPQLILTPIVNWKTSVGRRFSR